MIKVSIVTITYNHERYIAQALDSILSQAIKYDVEIIVADDCSKDNTSAIIEDFIDRYPGKIKAIFRKENIGAKNNFIDAIMHASGEYVALCEGDDYWSDPLKLQKQIDFMDANPDYSLCFTKASMKKGNHLDNEVINKSYEYIIKDKTSFELVDILENNFITTCTALYRSTILTNIDINIDLSFCDWYLHVLAARIGKIKYLKDNTAVYRVHESGMWSSTNSSERNLLVGEFYKFIYSRCLDIKEVEILIKVLLKRLVDFMNYSDGLHEQINILESDTNRK